MSEKDYIKINKEAYNKFAPQHKLRHEVLGKYDMTNQDWIDLISKKLINIKKINTVLEIGPGTGRILEIFEKDLNCRTIAVELAENMIIEACKKSPNTVFINDDVNNVKFFDDQFDAIFMGAVIHNFPKVDAEKILQKVYKWLKKDGKLLIYTTIHQDSEEGFFEKTDYNGKIVRYRRKYTEPELKVFIENLGFKIKYTMYRLEPDREKKWVVYICKK